MLDTVNGLPVHVLVVHAVVVGVPVLALLTVAVAARPAWRGRPAVVVAALLAGLLLLTWLATRSGEVLAGRVGEEVVAEHSELGGQLPWFVAGLLAMAVLVPVVRHRRPLAAAVLVLAVVVATANVVWVYRVGDSGSRAVWGPVIENTTPDE